MSMPNTTQYLLFSSFFASLIILPTSATAQKSSVKVYGNIKTPTVESAVEPAVEPVLLGPSNNIKIGLEESLEEIDIELESIDAQLKKIDEKIKAHDAKYEEQIKEARKKNSDLTLKGATLSRDELAEVEKNRQLINDPQNRRSRFENERNKLETEKRQLEKVQDDYMAMLASHEKEDKEASAEILIDISGEEGSGIDGYWLYDSPYTRDLTPPYTGGPFIINAPHLESEPKYLHYNKIADMADKLEKLKVRSKELPNEIADSKTPLPGLDLSKTDIKKTESLENELKDITNNKIPKLEADIEAKRAEYKATYMGEEKAEKKKKTAYTAPTNYITPGFSLQADYVYFDNEVPGTGTSSLLVPPNMTEHFLLGGDWNISGDGLDIGVNYNTGKALPEGIDKKRKSSHVGFNFNFRYLTGDDTRSAQYNPGDDKVAFIYQTKINISPGLYSTGVLLGKNRMSSTASLEYDETTFNAGFGWLCGDDLFSNAGWFFNPFANIGYRDIETNTKSRDYLTDFPNNFHAEAESRLDTSSLTGNIGANFIYPATNNLSLNIKPSIGIAYNDANLDSSQHVRAGGTPDVNIQLTDDKTWWSPEFSIGIGAGYNVNENFMLNLGYRYEYRKTGGTETPETGDDVLGGGSTRIGSEGTNNSSINLGLRYIF